MIRPCLIAIFSIFLLISCKTDSSKQTFESTELDYKSYLLKNQDSMIPTFDFSANYSISEVFGVIDDYTQQDCFDVFQFNYDIENIEIQSVALEYCHEFPPAAHWKTLRLETFGNNILMDQSEIDKTEIFSKSKEFFKDNTDIRAHFFIVFQSHNGTNDNELKEILALIISGYLAFIEDEFEKQYNFEISKASKTELAEFKSSNTLNLMFHPYSFSIPPPPPPAPTAEDFN